MKKVFSIIAVAAITATFVACGPSKEELEAAEKAKQDSIRVADSLAQVAAADSAAAAAAATVDTAAAATAAPATEEKK